MNKKLTNGLLGLGALLMASQVNATTTFSPEVNIDGTLENADFFYLSIPANFTLGLFDANDLGFSTALMVNTGNAVSFSPNTTGAGAYTATNDQSLLSIPIPTTLGGNAAFILGLFDSNTSTWLGDSGATDVSGGAGTAFNVSFTTASGQIMGVDMTLAQVPVPAAAWLFGSGLIGLVGVARRKKA